MSELVTQHDYRGHTIKIYVRPDPLGAWAWGYSIPTLGHKAYGARPVYGYDDLLTAALDQGKWHIDVFEDRPDGGASASPRA